MPRFCTEFSLKPDYAVSKKRYDAFWSHELVDRAPVCIYLPAEKQVEIPEKRYKCFAEKWLDTDFRAEQEAARLKNTVFYADALPIVWPNMGPEIFSAWCGCGYEFGETTAWSVPCIYDWETDAPRAVFNPEHPLFKKNIDYTKSLLSLAKGNFIVGLTDFHPGADHLAALRDPQNLATDLIDCPERVAKKLSDSYPEYFRAYDIFYQILASAGMPITSWTGLIHEGRFYIPSCDFSCMISSEMFDRYFLPGIAEECRFLDHSIYHLDGPGALRHLDSILQINELDAVQWVCGSGREGFAKWVKVYQKIQNAGKGLQLWIKLEELPLVFETLKPEGVWFSSINGIPDRDTADSVLKRIEKWK